MGVTAGMQHGGMSVGGSVVGGGEWGVIVAWDYGMAAILLDHVALSAARSRRCCGDVKGGASIRRFPGTFIIA